LRVRERKGRRDKWRRRVKEMERKRGRVAENDTV
jgi:hypothetical protein